MDRTRQEVGLLYEVSLFLGTSDNFEEALESVLALLAEQADMHRGTITLLAEEGDEVAIELAHGLSPEEMERGRYRVRRPRCPLPGVPTRQRRGWPARRTGCPRRGARRRARGAWGTCCCVAGLLSR